jgi:hypothetical protein
MHSILPFRAVLDALVSLLHGVRAVGSKTTRDEACKNPSGRTARFVAGQLVDCTAGPFYRFTRGRILQVVDHIPVDGGHCGHNSGHSAHYVIDLRDAQPASTCAFENLAIRYDWELSASN